MKCITAIIINPIGRLKSRNFAASRKMYSGERTSASPQPRVAPW
jgi:hypothetical protein